MIMENEKLKNNVLFGEKEKHEVEKKSKKPVLFELICFAVNNEILKVERLR